MVRCRECGTRLHPKPVTSELAEQPADATHPENATAGPASTPVAAAVPQPVAQPATQPGSSADRTDDTETPSLPQDESPQETHPPKRIVNRSVIAAGIGLVAVVGASVAIWSSLTGTSPPAETVWTESDILTAVAYSPDGQFLVAGSATGDVLLWNIHERKLQTMRPALSGPISALSVSDDGFAVAADTNQRLIGWDIPTGRREQLPRLPSAVTFIAFRPGQFEVTLGLQDGTLAVLTPAGLKGRPSRHKGGVKCGVYSQDGRRLITGGADGRVIVWNADDQTVIADKRGHAAEVSNVVLLTEHGEAVSADWNGEIVVWDIRSWNVVRRRLVADGIADLAVQQNQLVVASWSGSLQWRGLEDDRLLREGKLPGAILGIAASPDGNTVASVCGDRAIRLWTMLE